MTTTGKCCGVGVNAVQVVVVSFKNQFLPDDRRRICSLADGRLKLTLFRAGGSSKD